MSEQENKEEKTGIDVNVEINVIVIAISGATRSGKGTLARRLFTELGGAKCCKKLCQDSCFDLKMIFGEELKGNWEDPRALNHDQFLQNVNQLIADSKSKDENGSDTGIIKKYVILEGFLLFHDERILQLSDYKIWLEIPHDVCYERRMRTKAVPEQYFHSKLWPGYQAYRKRVFGNEKLVQEMIEIDGTLKMQIILQKALKQMGIEYEISENSDEAFVVEKPHFEFSTITNDSASKPVKPHPVDALNKMFEKNQSNRCLVM